MKTNTQLVKIDHKEFGIEESKANSILEKFEPLQIKMEELEEEYQEIIAMEISDPIAELKSKELGKKYMKIRTGRKAIHKEEKDFFLNAGRFIDRIKNDADKSTIEHEDKLEEIAKYHANLEAKKISDLANIRIEKLKEFDFDGSSLNLGTMDDNVWVSFLSGTKLEFENKKAIALKLEEERIAKDKADKEEQERIAIENAKLKAENEAKEKLLKEQKEKADKELAQAEALRKAEQEKADKVLEAQRKASEEKAKKEKAEADAKLKIEREAKEKLEAELLAQKEKERIAEEKKQAEIKAQQLAEAKAKTAPDKEKLNQWMNKLMIDITPSVGGDAHKVAIEIQDKFSKFKNWANEQIKTL